VIACIDRDLAVGLLIKDLADSRWYRNAAEHLTRLAPVEEIETLASLLNDKHLTSDWDGKHLAMNALEEIGTDEAINKIREFLENRSLWLQRPYIYGLGIVADPAMVEHLIYLLYEPDRYIHRSIEYPASEEHYADEAANLCSEAIDILEHIGGAKVFDWLHRAMYWVSNVEEYRSPFDKIVEVLFKLDSSRAFTGLEGAIHSHDPLIRKRAVIALSHWNISISDCNLSILLNSIDDPELEIQLEIIAGIRSITCNNNLPDITAELRDYAILTTKPILIKYANHPNLKIRDRVIHLLLGSEPDERELIISLLDNIDPIHNKILDGIRSVPIEPNDLPILLSYLNHDSINLRSDVIGNLGKTEDSSILPILLHLIHDPELEIREAAVISIVKLGIAAIFPTVLELSNNSELVTILINELGDLSEEKPQANIFKEFYKNKDATLSFLETTEQKIVNNIRNKTHHVNGEIFALREIGDDLAITALQEILEADDSYADVDQSIPALASIGTERAVSVLLSFLPDIDKFYGWIAIQFYRLGKLGLVPQLWSAAHQVYSDRTAEAISRIQEREGLYNPDFSDRSHPLFEPPRPRLRQFLLGDNE
jgi:HEAT repeat protein